MTRVCAALARALCSMWPTAVGAFRLGVVIAVDAVLCSDCCGNSGPAPLNLPAQSSQRCRGSFRSRPSRSRCMQGGVRPAYYVGMGGDDSLAQAFRQMPPRPAAASFASQAPAGSFGAPTVSGGEGSQGMMPGPTSCPLLVQLAAAPGSLGYLRPAGDASAVFLEQIGQVLVASCDCASECCGRDSLVLPERTSQSFGVCAHQLAKQISVPCRTLRNQTAGS